MRVNFDNSSKLIRFMLRRERLVSTVWIGCLVLFSVALAVSMSGMFPDEARQVLAETLKNPAMLAMVGPVYGADNYTIGAMFSNTMTLWLIITVAVMNIFLVVRHTRGDEEKGRIEVIRSLPTGRLSCLNAAILTAAAINVILALLTGVGIAMTGTESMDFGGSMLYGAVIGVSGMLFAALAALFSQISSSSRSAISYSFVVLGVFFLMRAAGDMGNEALSLASPIGLIQRSQIYVENHLWPLLIVLVEALILAAAAYALNAIRDIDQGFIHAKPGRREASALLRSPFGLAFRLLRNTMIVWIIVMFAISALYGSILGDIESFVAESDFYQMLIGANENYSTAEMYTAMVNSVMALICIVPVLTIAMKAGSEEKDKHAEHVLACVVSRGEYLRSYLIPAFIFSVLLQFVSALGLYSAAAAVLEEPISFTFMLKANLIYLPAIWLMTGVSVLLTGLFPKAAKAVWAYFAFSFFTIFFGRMLVLPDWLSKLSPFNYIPQLPVDSINYVTLGVLTIAAVALTAAGIVFYRRRDTLT